MLDRAGDGVYPRGSMQDTRRTGFRRSLGAALVCFLWTIAIWLVLYSVGSVARRRGLSAGGASLLSFSLPVLAGVLAYQLVMVPWLDGDGASPRVRFFWMILFPCVLETVVLFLAR